MTALSQINLPLPTKNASKVSAHLLKLYSEYQAFQKQKAAGANAQVFKPSTGLAAVDGESVVIDAGATDPKALATDLTNLGAKHVAVFAIRFPLRYPSVKSPNLRICLHCSLYALLWQ